MEKNYALLVLLVMGVSLFLFGCIKPPIISNATTSTTASITTTTRQIGDISSMKSFKSWDEVSSFIKASSGYGRMERMYADGIAVPMAAGTEKGVQEIAGATDYSTTNVQVEGVDEADIVKNDGKYIYAVKNSGYGYYGSGGNVVILLAYPPSEAKILSEIDVNGSVSELFVYGNNLVAFGSSYGTKTFPTPGITGAHCAAPGGCVIPPYYYDRSTAFMNVYDISDRSNPVLVKSIELKGSYRDSRMIAGKVYAIFSESAYYEYPRPLYAVDGTIRELAPSEVKYFDWPGDNYVFNVFLGIDLNDLSKNESRKVILMGYSQNIYVSRENIFITYTRYNYYTPQWEVYKEVLWDYLSNDAKAKIKAVDDSDLLEWVKDKLKVQEATNDIANLTKGIDDPRTSELYQKLQEKLSKIYERIERESEKTVVNEVALDGAFTYLGKGEAPGHVLNQFSMDEFNGYFRIATTTGRLMREGSTTFNHIYVLDSSLKVVGKLEDLAPGEKIYSARFMGNRAYLVTFKKVDPFFVIDLTEPTNPKLLGKLKIPGYSDYLHPYDENHVIGLGKGAVAAEEGDFAWYQGVKLSLFDVSDVSNPKETAKYEIGDRGTDSYALHDHKAFLFSKSKNLLVIPILLAKINPEKYPTGVQPTTYGDFVFQGAYVFRLTPEEGFVLKGTVTHADNKSFAKSGEYYWSNANVKRSLYMDDYLYTVSDRLIKANDLNTMTELASIQVSNATYYPKPIE
ncbi:beta-propeller domain-containing protein [Candidatus Micrarchaeota archaeon]|nr:beta-propeller domain-containing protein [Candidatus Micrarchaeota archaeon]